MASVVDVISMKNALVITGGRTPCHSNLVAGIKGTHHFCIPSDGWGSKANIKSGRVAGLSEQKVHA